MAACLITATHHPRQGLAIHQHCPCWPEPQGISWLITLGCLETEWEKERQTDKGEKGKEEGRRGKRQAWCGLCPTGARGQMDTQHAYADLELEALCLAGAVPGPSSCSISGSMTEGCSGVEALLPWRVE